MGWIFQRYTNARVPVESWICRDSTGLGLTQTNWALQGAKSIEVAFETPAKIKLRTRCAY
eukprot:768859-Amphidinium_carterae.1